jgi:hypothetical protein
MTLGLKGLGILGPQQVRGIAKSMTRILGLDFEILYIYEKWLWAKIWM